MEQMALFGEGVNIANEEIEVSNEQQSIALIETLPFELDQKVEVIPPVENECDIEDYYYLKDFAKKRGFVTEVHKGNRVSYTVDFNGRKGIFHHKDLISY
ncbi:hypothetical protein [Bacillus sp. AFS040349]|uniref:hypothetical protein n=1 Tax=Bacillus sp. AFS040349 TaxID=2033502 RepID=UPI000BFCE793|nr:hypothetical protein [Bacillus sp. AFS040349]PGT83297.1 hypothetical protein COD11_13255 [Bacillus sp. AFS040349]